MSEGDKGLRALELSAMAASACGFCGYFAAKQLTKPFVEEAIRHRGALLFGGVGFGIVALSALYAMLIVYLGAPRSKILAFGALLVSLGGSYLAWNLGWLKAGNPAAINVF